VPHRTSASLSTTTEGTGLALHTHPTTFGPSKASKPHRLPSQIESTANPDVIAAFASCDPRVAFPTRFPKNELCKPFIHLYLLAIVILVMLPTL
jgi:hypothetical protein